MKKRLIIPVLILLFWISNAQADGRVADYEVLEASDGNHIIVISQSISVRENASTRAKRISSEKSETIMEVTEDLENWYGVITPEGKEGYVRKGYTQRDYKYIRFNEPAYIRMLPYDCAECWYSPEYTLGKEFLVIGRYGEWNIVKLGKGIGYVRESNNFDYEEEEWHGIFRKKDYFKIISYGKVYLKTNIYIGNDDEGAKIGERDYEVFTCVGFWGDYWLVKYGDGGALIKMNSDIFTQAEIDYYYRNEPTYAITAWETEVNGRDGAGSIGWIEADTQVEVLAEEYPWYVIKYEYQGIPSIGWISVWDTKDYE